MAAVDLIKDAYRTYLGREASDDEANQWASGGYGYGDANNLNPVLDAIRNSDEAKSRQKAPTSHGYDQSGMGTPESGYGPGGVANPDYHGIGSADWDSFASELNKGYQQYTGRSASSDELLNWWSGNYGHGQGASGLPNFLNAIRGSGEAQAYRPAGSPATAPAASSSVAGPQGGDIRSWFSQLTGGKSPSPQSLKALEPILNQYGIKLGPNNARGFTDGIILPDGTFVDVITAATENGGQGWSWQMGGGGGPSMPGNQYSDPYTMLLEQLFKSRFGGDPNRAANEAALRNRANQLQQGNQYLDQQVGYLQKRFQDLQGPGYTGAENEVIRTSALDPIEQDRTQAKKMLANQLAAKGHAPGSGIYEAAMLELNKNFDAIRGATQTQLSGNELARRENRNQRAEAISGTLAQIPEERNRELLDVMNAIDRLSSLTRSEEDAYARELSNLGPQRLGLAMQAVGAGGVTPSALGSLLTQIAGLNQNSQAYNAQNSNALWSSLGQLAAIMGRQGQWGLG